MYGGGISGVNALSGLISFLQYGLGQQHVRHICGVNALSGLISFLPEKKKFFLAFLNEECVNALSGLISFLHRYNSKPASFADGGVSMP